MALVKYGEMIADLRGKINGTVHSRNRAGAYMRNLVIPTNPQTAAQMAVRSRLGGNSSAWRGLTQAQRDAWNAAAVNFPSINVFGDSRILSGNSLYIGLNNNLANAGAAGILVPPAPTGAITVDTVAVTASTGPDLVSIAFTATPVPANHTLVIDATPNISAGINNFNSVLRQINTEIAAAASPSDSTVEYVAKYGALVVGMKVGVRVRQINAVTGEASVTLTGSTIVI